VKVEACVVLARDAAIRRDRRSIMADMACRTPIWLHAVFRPTDFRLGCTPSSACSDESGQTLEQEQRSETVAMEMVSGGCVGQGREKEREERCEQDTEVARGRPYGCGLAQVMCAWAGGARVQSDRVTRWREKSF
jgi:hypothetical protein